MTGRCSTPATSYNDDCNNISELADKIVGERNLQSLRAHQVLVMADKNTSQVLEVTES